MTPADDNAKPPVYWATCRTSPGCPRDHDLTSTLLDMGATDEIALLGLLADYAIAIGATLLSLRRDRHLGFLVAVTASLLLSPLLWHHYLALLVLLAAFLAQRWSPWRSLSLC